MVTKIYFSLKCVILSSLCFLFGMGCGSGGSDSSRIFSDVTIDKVEYDYHCNDECRNCVIFNTETGLVEVSYPIVYQVEKDCEKTPEYRRNKENKKGSLVNFSNEEDPEEQNVNYVSITVGNHTNISANVGLSAGLYDKYEARIVNESNMVAAISYANEDVYNTAKTLTPETSNLLKIYGLIEGKTEIEIWAINSWGEEVCIAGDMEKHGSTAIFNKIVVEVVQ